MHVPEGLFGVTHVPDWTRRIILSPEVQRLREIRLINTSTPFLPALSDVRRFTHTIGVAHLVGLASGNDPLAGSVRQQRVMLAAALLHDVGSPPFGHLFEYLLNAQFGWTHEAALQGIIEGTYRPDNQFHQIYYQRTLALGRILSKLEIDAHEVSAVVNGTSALSPLLAGSIDCDNIDNVYRMATLLGLPASIQSAERLASALTVMDGRIALPRTAIGALEDWRRLRRKCYEILAFDIPSLSGQAMLTDAITGAMEDELIGVEHWFLTDEDLLRRLTNPNSATKRVKETARRFALGDFYECVFLAWYELPRQDRDLRSPAERRRLQSALQQALGIPCTPYVFYDKGAFEKTLRLVVTEDSEADETDLTLGIASASTVAAVFTPRRLSRVPARWTKGAAEVFSGFGLDPASRRPVPRKGEVYDVPGQEKIRLGTPGT